MHEHFYAITAMIDKSKTVPDELRYTEKKWIYLESEQPIDAQLELQIFDYCDKHNLIVKSGKYENTYLLIVKNEARTESIEKQAAAA